VRSLVLAAVVVASSACATTAPSAPKSDTPKPTTSAEAIADVYDKCPAILETCGFEDEDGCPDPFFSVGDRCLATRQDQEEIDRAAAQILGNPHIDVVELVSADQACAYRFVARLVRGGVAPTRLRVRLDRAVTGLTWGVVSLDGKPC
jgi:hypothetical protein